MTDSVSTHTDIQARVNDAESRWLDVPPPYDEALAQQAQVDVLTACGDISVLLAENARVTKERDEYKFVIENSSSLADVERAELEATIERLRALLRESQPGAHAYDSEPPHPQYGYDRCRVCGEDDPLTLRHRAGEALGGPMPDNEPPAELVARTS